jgi:hypothetical protein
VGSVSLWARRFVGPEPGGGDGMKNVTPGRGRAWLTAMVEDKRASLKERERIMRGRSRRAAFWFVSLTVVALFSIPVLSLIAFWLAVIAGLAMVGSWHEMRVARLQRAIEPEVVPD